MNTGGRTSAQSARARVFCHERSKASTYNKSTRAKKNSTKNSTTQPAKTQAPKNLMTCI